jgi:hypothetical protein
MIGHAKRRLLATDRQQEIRLSSVFLPSHRKRPPPSSTAQIRPLLEFFASREVPQSISSRVRKFHLATPQPPRMCSPVFLKVSFVKISSRALFGISSITVPSSNRPCIQRVCMGPPFLCGVAYDAGPMRNGRPSQSGQLGMV